MGVYRVLNRAKIDALAVAYLFGAPCLFSKFRISRELGGLCVQLMDCLGLPIIFRVLPGSRFTDFFPYRIEKRFVDLLDQPHHPHIAHIGMMAFLIDIEPRHCGFQCNELRAAYPTA